MVPQKDILACVKYWQKLFGLSRYKITVRFETEQQDSIAECGVQSEYELASINFNLKNINSPAEAEATVIHELLHIVLAPLATNAKVFAGECSDVVHYLEEQVVTSIEKWPLWQKIG